MKLASRNRGLWAGLIAVVVVFGLGTRWQGLPFPRALIGYVGDAAWAHAVFLGYGLLFSRSPTGKVALAAAATSLLVELSQLYHAVWIDSIRDTTFGRLILGSDFDPIDLLCYAGGITIGVLVDIGVLRTTRNRLPHVVVKPPGIAETDVDSYHRLG